MSPPIPLEQQCGQPVGKATCVLKAGHKHPRHRPAKYLAVMRAADTPERRQKYRSHNHRLPSTWYAEQFEKQEGKCAICRKTPEENGRALAIDHDHTCCPGNRSGCGKCARGLLCNDCNLMLGRAHDNLAILLAAVRYLS